MPLPSLSFFLFCNVFLSYLDAPLLAFQVFKLKYSWVAISQLVAQTVKNLPANAGDIRDVGLIPGSGRSPGGGHGSPLQYSCLENPMERGAWQATVHAVPELDMTEAT